MNFKFEYSLLDLDSVLHIVANKQYKAGNRDNIRATKNNVMSFISTIRKSSKAEKSVGFYQVIGHKNFRNEILPEYKGHRVTSDAIKCWKPTIIEAFQEAGLFPLKTIESDDACSFLANHLGYNNVVVVSADKDMIQIPSAHFNPFKANLKPEERWKFSSPAMGMESLYKQVITGDPTDMPGELCGIEGVAGAKVKPMVADCNTETEYLRAVKKAYSDAYGAREGYIRANRTYMMVRLLTGENDHYASPEVQEELRRILQGYSQHSVKPNDDVGKLFTKYKPTAAELFGL